MTEPHDQINYLFEGPIPDERARLVRLCSAITGRPEAAEDLAQQTLLEAWRSRSRLVEPEGYSRWLSAVARNVCLRWMREQGIRSTRESEEDPEEEQAAAETPDLEIELERSELAELLDRALSELPADTRTALVQRYLLELPQAEIAARMGLSEGAVEARLHRGKISLHNILLDRYRPEAAEFGLAPSGSAGWVETRIWCPICGQHRLYGALPKAAGQFELHCPACSWNPGSFFAQSTMSPEYEAVNGYRATLKRLNAYLDRLFRLRPEPDFIRCERCGGKVPLQYEIPASVPRYPNLGRRGFYFRCPNCGRTSHSDIYGIALDTPAGQSFWRDNPRIRTLPEMETSAGDRPALLLRFESVTASNALEVVLDRERYAVVDTRAVGQL